MGWKSYCILVPKDGTVEVGRDPGAAGGWRRPSDRE
jgi:hypothetical protein